jgi:hypothetical protein
MSVEKKIIEFVGKLAPGKAFVTRQLLPLAKRGALDQALHRLVKKNFLVRLARGVFCQDRKDCPLPGIIEIVRLKAEAFGKKIATHGLDALKFLKMRQSGNKDVTVATNGKSSSFVVLGVRVHLRGTTMTRVTPGDSRAGLAIRALAHLKRQSVNPSVVRKSCKNFDIHDVFAMRKQFPPLMTGWMSDIVVHSGIALGKI